MCSYSFGLIELTSDEHYRASRPDNDTENHAPRLRMPLAIEPDTEERQTDRRDKHAPRRICHGCDKHEA